MSKPVTFISKEGTRYTWDRSKETFVQLTDLEVNLMRLKVMGMNDADILNRTSGNGIPMGIPITFSKERLISLRDKLLEILKAGPFIGFEDHALERIIEDSLLSDDDPNKRGWTSKEEAENCVMKAKKITGVRFNVDHRHPKNTETEKFLHPHLGIVITGEKTTGEGRMVLVVLTESTISVVTVL
ncbi:hypothetical protein [Paenibacillus solani]|uniref:Uncharacterized protein n=1 Tax=Paenibacillus solani TaxID=1705565 RepID=A0A0M1P070_9BACL|nr:hypothetical protein [Paenibacillus solani]KOR87797.1 hypothetical protein AM231_00660 [Paenibacillus solani]